ncbi:MAG: hypothetical protein JSW50_09985, partial [Candidatus Latescibacterota bacterium]
MMRKYRKASFCLALLLIPVLLGVGSMGCGDDSVAPNTEDDGGGNGESQLDTIPPAAVTDLRQRTPTYQTVALAWTAPGDDGHSGTADRYEIRHSKSPITMDNWDAATALDPNIIPTPKPAGQIETIVVTNLDSGTEYHFALRTIDEKDNKSDISNNASGSTLTESFPPADVTDLAASAISTGSFELTWTAPGDDFMAGTATKYDIRYSPRAIVSQADWDHAIKVAEPPAPRPGGE